MALNLLFIHESRHQPNLPQSTGQSHLFGVQAIHPSAPHRIQLNPHASALPAALSLVLQLAFDPAYRMGPVTQIWDENMEGS